jgi:voltage-gated sodium channel
MVESPRATKIITALIILNAVVLGLETSDYMLAHYGGLLAALDKGILVIFTLEVLAKLRLYGRGFFRSGWNWFDFIIISISWVPASGALSVLRALRILRVLRLLSVVPQMRRVISSLGHAIPGMASVMGVLGLLYYVSAVLATKLFGTHPDPNMQAWFGTLGDSAYTLFQIMTLESWSMGIVRPTMELFPWAWVFFVPFIIVTSFAVLNLFIGIIVDAMHTSQQEAVKDTNAAPATEEDIKTILAKLEVLEKSISNR